VNAHQAADTASLKNNIICINNIEKWKLENRNCFFRTYCIDVGTPSIKGWGAGLARKTGMDEALRRYDKIEKPEGVIVSLDADCIVEKNYLTSICDELFLKKHRNGCSIKFGHPLSGTEFPGNVYKYITLYELHMRYFYQAVKFSGFPDVFHTIGSAIAFRASAYLKAGGMNRNKAGEDFYFIQKLVPQGGYFELNSTTVHPSPRSSARVPFGTGPVIARLLDGQTNTLLTYNPDAFSELKLFFSGIEKLFNTNEDGIIDYYNSLPPGVKSFTGLGEWIAKISEIKGNTSGEDSFKKRFFGWFNMFRIVRYLNHVHLFMFEKKPVTDAARNLIFIMRKEVKEMDPYDLLIYYRLLEVLPG